MPHVWLARGSNIPCWRRPAKPRKNAKAKGDGRPPITLLEPAQKRRQQWRDAFVCLRVVGKNVWHDLPAPPAARDDFAAFAVAPTPPADRRPLPATTRLPLDMMAPPSKRTPTLSGGSFGALPKRPPREGLLARHGNMLFLNSGRGRAGGWAA